MGGRGSSSMSGRRSGGGGAGISKEMQDNARRHAKYVAGELNTKITKNDQFAMDVLFPDMDYNKTGSGSSVYANANRVSRDEEHIAVLVPHSALHETPYGFALQLDEEHVQYVKTWQLTSQVLPYRGIQGTNVSLSKKYWNPKKTKYKDPNYSSDPEQLSWDTWVQGAKAQQAAGNVVSIRKR